MRQNFCRDSSSERSQLEDLSTFTIKRHTIDLCGNNLKKLKKFDRLGAQTDTYIRDTKVEYRMKLDQRKSEKNWLYIFKTFGHIISF